MEKELEHKPTSTIRGDVLVLLSMAMFASYALFLRFFPEIPTAAFLLAFQVVGAIVFGTVLIFRKNIYFSRRHFWLFGALAVVALANDLLYFVGFRMTEVANVAVAHQSVSIFLLFLAPRLLKEKTRKEEWGALAVSLVGIMILYSNQFGVKGSDFWGITAGVASGFFYALLIILYNHLQKQEGLSVRLINFWRHTLSTIILLPLMGLLGGWSFDFAADWKILALFGFLFAVVASSMHQLGMGKTRALHVSILGKAEPVFATIYALFIFDTVPSLQTIIGGILIIGSSVWLTTRKTKEA